MTTGVVRLRLSEILAELGWTQRELAKRTGLSENAISNLTHTPARISFDTLNLICQATGKTPGDLIVRDETES